MLKNWCFWTVVLEETVETSLGSRETKPADPKADQSWNFFVWTDVEAEGPILWPSDAKSRLIREDSDAGKEWRQEEKGMTVDEMVGWHHQFNEHAFEKTLGEIEGQGSLLYCSPWGHKESDTTDSLNNKLDSQGPFCFLSTWSGRAVCHRPLPPNPLVASLPSNALACP